MTIKKLAIGISMTLVLTATNANAKSSNQVTQFCGDRVCGYVETITTSKKQYKKIVKWTRKIKQHKYSYKKTVTKITKNIKTNNKVVSTNNTLLGKAERYLGTNPTGWSSLWCARFIAVIAPDVASRLKAMKLNPNWARDYAKLPGAKRHGSPGDIIVLTRGKAGHIGVLKGYDANNNPIVISGNHNRRVGEGVYRKGRVIAYVSPS